MTKKIITWMLLVSIITPGLAQSVVVSNSSQISLITCSPGSAAYEKFGHTALRFYNSETGFDMVFNYGIFDFNQSGFYYKFVKGETYYLLGMYDMQLFTPQYVQRNSQVTEQILNLTKEEEQYLIDALFLNYLPENRTYLYNFIFDNCATRPRDKVLELFSGKKIAFNLPEDNRSFREWVAEYAGKNSWLMFGIDLVFGRKADRMATKWETMFLPDALSREFDAVQIIENDSVSRPLIKSKSVLVPKKEQKEPTKFRVQPVFVTLLILAFGVLLTFYERRKRTYFKLFDSLLLIVTGLAGLIIFYLMFFSIHPLVKMNINLLWCNPLNIFLGIILWVKSLKKIAKILQTVNVLLFLGAFILAVMFVQVLNLAFFPLMALLLLRSLSWLQIKLVFKSKK